MWPTGLKWRKKLPKNLIFGQVTLSLSLSIIGRTTLINSSLTNSSIYHMSMFLLPKTVIHRMDKGRRKFFWQGGHVKKKYHLIKMEENMQIQEKGRSEN
jgi:hypothetical protein